jgi:hypothetical protein
MKKALLLIAIVALLLSCSNFMYYPSVANAPLLQEKDEIKISAGLKGYAGYATAAYALTKHIGLQAGTNLLYLDVTELGEDYKIGNFNGEIAAGLYFPFAEVLVAELYLGGGLGSASAKNINSNSLTMTYSNKVYLQGNFGFRTKYFSGGLAFKEVLVNIYKEIENGVDTGNRDFDTFFEPFVFLSVGGEHNKITLQAGLSESQLATIDYAPFIVALGYEYQFDLKK